MPSGPNPDLGNPQAHFERGGALAELLQFERAVACYDQAIALKPDYAEAYAARGVALLGLKKFEQAVTSFEFALFMNPDLAWVHFHRAEALRTLNEPEAAIAAYEKALAIDPDNGVARGQICFMQMLLCDWPRAAATAAQLVSGIGRSRNPPSPFPLLALSDSPALLHEAAAHYGRVNYPRNDALGPIPRRGPAGKIHIGYYSADYENHATMHLMAGVFEHHDRSVFEVTAFSFGRESDDHMRARAVNAVDRFIDVRMTSDRDVARMSRELGIDIAVDMKGYTRDRRTGIFAFRAAPIQVGYLAYPGGSGLDYIDYLLADETVVPREHRAYYSEKIAWLPHSYQCNDSKREFPQPRQSRAALGLPETGFVFCGFNSPFKISPETFGGWMRILAQVEGSVLWLLEDNAVAANNLRKAAQAQGIDPGRLIFAPRVSIPEHLARHALADLFLDSLPYNAHTTASDALWMELPVLTCLGKTFPGRVAASLLRALDLPELIASTQADFEAAAVKLARSPSTLAALREKLRAQRLSAPLFDTALFTSDLEAVYRTMQGRYQDGLPPDHIEGPRGR